MPYRKLILTLTVGSVIGLTGIYLFNLKDFKNESLFDGITEGNYLQFHHSHKLEILHTQRIQHMTNACKEYGNEFAKYATTSFLYSPKYHFHFCSVPKVGSTFWQKIVRILENGVDHLDDVLYKNRRQIHKGDSEYQDSIEDRNNDDTIAMISRDPYSRLYSAYVDKEFLKPYSSSCKERSFETYLMAIFNSKHIATVDHHVRPVSAICDPCALKPNYLLKQETFAEDVLFTLHELGINNGEMRVISELLSNLRPENNIPGIVKIVYELSRRRQDLECFTWTSVARRLWKSFQIQGYIDERVEFPTELFKGSRAYKNSSFLIETMLETIHDAPLTKLEIQEQRQNALIRAYADVSDDVIRMIRKRYNLDFRLFNYNTDPPGIDTNR